MRSFWKHGRHEAFRKVTGISNLCSGSVRCSRGLAGHSSSHSTKVAEEPPFGPVAAHFFRTLLSRQAQACQSCSCKSSRAWSVACLWIERRCLPAARHLAATRNHIPAATKNVVIAFIRISNHVYCYLQLHLTSWRGARAARQDFNEHAPLSVSRVKCSNLKGNVKHNKLSLTP